MKSWVNLYILWHGYSHAKDLMPQPQISGQTQLRGIGSPHLVHVQRLIMCAGNILVAFSQIFLLSGDCSIIETAPSKIIWTSLLLSAVYNNPASLLICVHQPCFLVYLNVISLLHCSAVFTNPTPYSTMYRKHSELPGCCSFSITAILGRLIPVFLCIHVCQFQLHSYTTSVRSICVAMQHVVSVCYLIPSTQPWSHGHMSNSKGTQMELGWEKKGENDVNM